MVYPSSAVQGRESNWRPVYHKSDALSATPTSHLEHCYVLWGAALVDDVGGSYIGYDLCVRQGPIPMMIGAELFRQGPRPRAMSIAGLTNWLFTAVVALSFELVQVTIGFYLIFQSIF